MKSLFVILLSLSLSTQVIAQDLLGFGTVWDDNLTEWVIQFDGLEAELSPKWLGNISEWKYELSDGSIGTIRLKWRDDPTQWELRSNTGVIVSARTVWPNNLLEWRLTDNDQSIKLQQKWNNDINEWSAKSASLGKISFETVWTNDPREWQVEDQSLGMDPHYKLALVFLTVFHSIQWQ